MNDNIFDNNVTDNIENEIDQVILEILNNYKLLIEDSFKILNLYLENNINKPLILYNLFFVVELYLKYYLIRKTTLSIEEIENYGHEIFLLLDLANKVEKYIDFNELKQLLKKFKDKNNHSLNLNKYYDFKYNRKKKINYLIFDFKINKSEIKNVKDVIKWLQCHM